MCVSWSTLEREKWTEENVKVAGQDTICKSILKSGISMAWAGGGVWIRWNAIYVIKISRGVLIFPSLSLDSTPILIPCAYNRKYEGTRLPSVPTTESKSNLFYWNVLSSYKIEDRFDKGKHFIETATSYSHKN